MAWYVCLAPGACFSYLALHKVTNARLRHDGNGHGILDLLDQVRVGHAGDAALGADVGGDALEGHDGAGAGFFGDAGLLGVDDVHDDAAFEHLGEPGFGGEGGFGVRGGAIGGGGGGVVAHDEGGVGEGWRGARGGGVWVESRGGSVEGKGYERAWRGGRASLQPCLRQTKRQIG